MTSVPRGRPDLTFVPRAIVLLDELLPFKHIQNLFSIALMLTIMIGITIVTTAAIIMMISTTILTVATVAAATKFESRRVTQAFDLHH